MSSPEDERFDEDVEPFEQQVQGEAGQEGPEPEFEEEPEQYTTNVRESDDNAVLVDVETDEEASYALSEADEIDVVSDDTNTEGVMSAIDDYTEDEEVLQDFEERQHLSSGGRQLHERLRQHHAETPALSGGDVDAAWDQSEVGDHLVSTEPTPDRDLVDEIGEGAGLTYDDDEPLDFERKVWARDRERWELNPDSADDELDREERDEED